MRVNRSCIRDSRSLGVRSRVFLAGFLNTGRTGVKCNFFTRFRIFGSRMISFGSALALLSWV
jgi:hypothetical protein